MTNEGGELRILRLLVDEVRKVVPKDFIVGVKLNAGDYTTAASDDPALTPKEERALGHMKQIASWGGVDFIEISGGDYETVGPCFCVRVYNLDSDNHPRVPRNQG